MDHSLFYIAGGALIACALILSLVGMRSEKFPSGGFLKAGVLVIALLVATTSYGAIKLYQEEQANRLEEANTTADVAEQQQNVQNQDTGNAPATQPPSAQIDAGQLFVDNGCGTCHVLSQLGADAQGVIGPNLNEALTEDDQAAIAEMIVDPEKEIANGYTSGVMPATFGDQLTTEEVDALAAYLYEASHTKG